MHIVDPVDESVTSIRPMRAVLDIVGGEKEVTEGANLVLPHFRHKGEKKGIAVEDTSNCASMGCIVDFRPLAELNISTW